MPTRPTVYSPEVIAAVVDKILPEVIEWLQENPSDDESIKDQLSAAILQGHNEPYKIATYLDRCYSWEVNSGLVDIFEVVPGIAYRHRDELVAKWVVANQIKPNLKLGDTVKFNQGSRLLRTSQEHGEIVGIDSKTATYTVFCSALGHVKQGLGSHGTIVPYEDVAPWSDFLAAVRQVTDIVCHDNCADGTMAAILLHDVLPHARIQFCQHGAHRENLEVKPGMLFCDFAPPQSSHKKFVEAGAIVLDHHKSEKATVEAFGDRGIFADEVQEPGVSGAVLAYRHCWLPLKQHFQPDEWERAESLSSLVGIRDTWQKHDPEWPQACELTETLRFFSPESWLIERPFTPQRRAWWEARGLAGKRLTEKLATTIGKVLEGAYRFTSARGTRVLMFSGTTFSSDASEASQDCDLVVGFDYFAVEDGKVPLGFSTQSPGASQFDCGDFCKSQGGGGHVRAAGFTVKLDPTEGSRDPFSLFRDTLDDYEGG